MDKIFYITTPIYYVNDVPHIGHAYTTTVSDMIARFMRLDGYQVKFLTGTDEHGQKVEKSAFKAGKSPQEFVDEVSQNFRDLGKLMNFSQDDFIRTTQSRHIAAAQHLWKVLKERDEIYLGSYQGWYALRDETFYAESELVNGKAPTGAEVEWVEEPSYFFRLSKWQEPLLKFYHDYPDFIAPTSRRNEVIRFVEGGLHDLSVSRTSFKWGIPIPEDPNHIMYVWLDALTNYITAVGYPQNMNQYHTYWPHSLHIVGKDILRFHTVYWPAFLMAAGLMPPQRVFAHGFWTHEGQKMSKSLRNGVDPVALAHRYGVDQVRYFLLREVPFGEDGDFSERAFIGRINSELANDLGNLVQRVLSMIYKNCDAKIPLHGSFTEADVKILESTYDILEQLRPLVRESQELHKVCEMIWGIIREANRYVDHMAPWVLRKENPERMETVLYVLAEVIRCVGILIRPLMPTSADHLLDQLGVPFNARTFRELTAGSALTVGQCIQQPKGLFPRIEGENIL